MFSKVTNIQVKIALMFILIAFVAGLLSGCSYRDESPAMKECEKMYKYNQCMKILHGAN